MWLAFLFFWAGGQTPELQVRMQDAVAALQRSDFAAARTELEQAVRLAPSNATAWFLLAQTRARQKDLPSAVSAADRAAQNADNDSTMLYNLALLFRNLGQPERAIAAGERALALENSADVRTLLGKAYVDKKEWKRAIAELTEARALSPYSEEAIFNLAQAYLQSMDFPGAIAALEEGRKTFDKSPQIELALGVAYYGQRRFADAVGRFLRVIELDPSIAQPYYFLGKTLEHATDRLSDVLIKAQEFEKLNPGSPLGYVLHAKAIILQLPPEEDSLQAQTAHDLLLKAISLKEDQPESHFLLGILLERKKDYAAAAAQFERSVALNSDDPKPHFRLARVYDRLGRKEDAARERALNEKLSSDSNRDQP